MSFAKCRRRRQARCRRFGHLRHDHAGAERASGRQARCKEGRQAGRRQGFWPRAAHYVAPEDALWSNVALGQWRLIGPRLAGAIVFLSLRMRLSRARIREFFIELFGLYLSTGVLDETIREAGRAVAPLEDAMALEIEEAALLHADETPWKEAGKPLWLWVFVAGFTTLFYIGYRSLEILSNVLTGKFKGNLMSDGYLAYRHLGNRLRCWAHLLRKCQGLIESTDAKVARAGKGMHDVLCTLMEAIYAARAVPTRQRGALASRYATDIARLRALCERHSDDGHDKLRSLAREFLLDWEVILRQVAEPHLPLTNNAAEQALRHWVIARRINISTRSEAGARAFALLASVMDLHCKRDCRRTARTGGSPYATDSGRGMNDYGRGGTHWYLQVYLPARDD